MLRLLCVVLLHTEYGSQLPQVLLIMRAPAWQRLPVKAGFKEGAWDRPSHWAISG